MKSVATLLLAALINIAFVLADPAGSAINKIALLSCLAVGAWMVLDLRRPAPLALRLVLGRDEMVRVFGDLDIESDRGEGGRLDETGSRQ